MKLGMQIFGIASSQPRFACIIAFYARTTIHSERCQKRKKNDRRNFPKKFIKSFANFRRRFSHTIHQNFSLFTLNKLRSRRHGTAIR